MARVLWSSSSLTPAHRLPACTAKRWWIVDAKGHRVGRLANQIKDLLTGKWKPTFVKGVDCGDHVIVVNAKHVQLSGKKWEKKIYTWHTGHPGGLRRMKVLDMLQRKPEEIIKRAALGMIHKGRQREAVEERFHIYPDIEHPHTSQKPTLFFPNKTINDTAWPILEHEEEFQIDLWNEEGGKVGYDFKVNKMFTKEDRIARYYAKQAGDMGIAKRRARTMPQHLKDEGYTTLYKMEDEQQQSLIQTMRREQYSKYKDLLTKSRKEGEKVIADYEHPPDEWIKQPKEKFFPPGTQNDSWNYDNVYGKIDREQWENLRFPLRPDRKYSE